VFDGYGLVVVDECHHIPAVSFSTCVQKARTRRRLGLTATPYRRDKLEALIRDHARNVKRWQPGGMRLRWAAAGMLTAATQFEVREAPVWRTRCLVL
jgi:hypothetical protein